MTPNKGKVIQGDKSYAEVATIWGSNMNNNSARAKQKPIPGLEAGMLSEQ